MEPNKTGTHFLATMGLRVIRKIDVLMRNPAGRNKKAYRNRLPKRYNTFHLANFSSVSDSGFLLERDFKKKIKPNIPIITLKTSGKKPGPGFEAFPKGNLRAR